MFAAVAALGLSSCSETWDGNPVLPTHEGTPTVEILNKPALQDMPIMLTNDNADGNFHLTCSQPDYGYAAVATYKVQCSLTPDFADYREIEQSFYNCAEINPINGDVAAALEYLSGVRTEDDLPLAYQTLYMRLRVYVAQDEANTTYFSNVVSFQKVSADYLAIWVADVPANLYLRGGMNEWGADAAWRFATGTESNTWVIKNVTIPAGTEFKVADSNWGPINLGSGDSNVVVPGEKFTLNGGENPGNLTVTADFTGRVQLSLVNGVYELILDPAN